MTLPVPLYRLEGIVIRGRGIGKLLGTPTADLDPRSFPSLPPKGVYLSIVRWRQSVYYGVTHIGPRPTVDNDPTPSLETLLLDFDAPLYGERLRLELFQRLRPIRKFQSMSLLRSQIFADRDQARLFFRLPQEPLSPVWASRGLSLDPAAQALSIQGRTVLLTGKEFQVLRLLLRRPGIPLSKAQIYEEVWRMPADAACHPVENIVSQLRGKLPAPLAIRGVRGYGYRLELTAEKGPG